MFSHAVSFLLLIIRVFAITSCLLLSFLLLNIDGLSHCGVLSFLLFIIDEFTQCCGIRYDLIGELVL